MAHSAVISVWGAYVVAQLTQNSQLLAGKEVASLLANAIYFMSKDAGIREKAFKEVATGSAQKSECPAKKCSARTLEVLAGHLG